MEHRSLFGSLRPVALAAAVAAGCALAGTSPVSATTEEPTLESIVSRAIEALGGQERWDQVRSLRYTGTFSTFGSRRPFEIQRKRPNLYRFDHYFNDGERALVFDGTQAWWLNRALAARVPWPEETPIADSLEISGDAEFGSPLLDLENKGHRVELEGFTEYDGEPAWEVVIHLAHGPVERWYFDPETFLPIVRVSSGSDLRQPTSKKTFFLDYREVDGLMVPHHMDIELGYRFQSLVVERVEINPEIDDSVFRMPLPEGLEAFRGLEGPWEVSVETRVDPKMPWIPSRTTTTWNALDQGHLLTEELSYVDFGSYRRTRRWLTYDAFQEIYRVHRYNNLSHHVEILEGTFENGRLVVSNLSTRSAWQLGDRTVHTRETTHEIGADGFKIDLETSSDGGQTWIPTTRLVYRRPATAPTESLSEP